LYISFAGLAGAAGGAGGGGGARAAAPAAAGFGTGLAAATFVAAGIAGAAGAPGGAVGLVAPGSCLAAGRLFDRPYPSVWDQAVIRDGLTAIPAGAALAAFFRLGILGG
jgi:hypothetical protein